MSSSCAEDMKTYMIALRRSEEWALKINDASGRYRGLYFFANDFWLGSKEFCYEINNEYKKLKNIPPLKFYVVKSIVKLHLLSQKVSFMVNKNHKIRRKMNLYFFTILNFVLTATPTFANRTMLAKHLQHQRWLIQNILNPLTYFTII
jgi:hypothetical protein